ncbi:MAG: TetR/AcrR family transcriptional regulator [Candidatus Eisenbacteria bacterium]|nr:TetR/AcrR family transcriptional regulator [Candidatus Eisenbacteria bacterium]
MEANGKCGTATKKLVLEAACKVFSEVGYHEGTVARICEEAGANRAAVNYHFGDKQNLYREVWNHSYTRAHESYPMQPTRVEASPEDALRAFIRSLVLQAFDSGPAGQFVRIIAFEMADPMEFLTEERTRVREDLFDLFEGITLGLVGSAASRDDLALCRIMVLAPSLGIGMRRFGCHAKRVPHAMFESDPEEMVERMFRFALAGIEDLRSGIRRRDAAGEGGA